MLDRSRTWWRALGAGATVLLTVAWPSAAGAATWRTSLVHQDAVVTFDAKGQGTLSLALFTGGVNGDEVTVDISVYQPLVNRTDLTPILDGQGVSQQPLSSTGSFPLNCRSAGVATFDVTVGARTGTAASTCGGAQPYLSLNCQGLACDAVYPVALRATNGTSDSTIWTLLTVAPSGSPTPVELAWIFEANPTTHQGALAESRALRTIARFNTVPLTVAVDYEGLYQVAIDPSSVGATYRRAMRAALASTLHDLADAPPASIDFASLASNGLLVDAVTQTHMASSLVNDFVSKVPVRPLVLSGAVGPGDVRALGAIGESQLVLPDGSLRLAPSSSLSWGTPFYVTNGSPRAIAVSTDSPLRRLALDQRLSPGLRTALVVGTLSLLHYESPFAPEPRLCVVNSPLRSVGPQFLTDLLSALRHDPLVHLTGLPHRITTALVGANGYPIIRALSPSGAPAWTGANVNEAANLEANFRAFAESISTTTPTTVMQVARLLAERRSSPGERSHDLGVAVGTLNAELHHFSINNTTITLTGSGTPLPITLTSNASYTVRGFLSVSAPNVTFPDGNVIPISLSTNTRAIRVPANVRGPGNFTLVVKFLSVDRHLVFAQGAIQVRSTETSFLGYVLTFGSLFIIAVWWYRTTRRATRGRHAA